MKTRFGEGKHKKARKMPDGQEKKTSETKSNKEREKRKITKVYSRGYEEHYFHARRYTNTSQNLNFSRFTVSNPLLIGAIYILDAGYGLVLPS